MGIPKELKDRMLEEKVNPRFLVVDADPLGYMNKDVSCSFYPFGDKAQAERFAAMLYEHRVGMAMTLGGYPGSVYVLDLCDPDCYDDSDHMWSYLSEMHEEDE